MRSPFFDRPGAVAAAGPDTNVPAHYGDPFREQRWLAEDGAIVDRGNRGIVRVTGPDRLSWLHSITSQHLEALPAWEVREGLVLSPHGHVEHHFVAVDDGTATWLDVEPGTAGGLVAYLESMRFMLRVEVADESSQWAVLTVTGVEGLLTRLGAVVPEAAGQAAPLPGGGIVRRREWPRGGADVVVREGMRADVAADAPSPVAGLDAYEALRVAARAPRLGFETDHRTIPHEIGWLESAVHLDKGCYRGQETVARVHNLGRPPRRLVLLHLDGSEVRLPAHGDPVEMDGRAVGFVGTAVRHYELGPIALAVVKRATPDDALLTAGGVPAKAERVVDA